MRLTLQLSGLLFGMLLLVNPAYAETPREQLKQMVEQLQKNPADNALRERIIKLAQEIKPAPAVPEEAERRMMRGTAALEGVKSVADYQNAAKEFEQATLAAPWYGDAYFNLGVAQDKAENYEAALRSLKLALLASPNDKEIKALIFKVEYRKERESSPEVLAAKMKQQEQETRRAIEEMIRGLDGAEFAGEWPRRFLRVRGNHVEYMDRKLAPHECQCDSGVNCDAPIGAEEVCHSAQIMGRIAEYKTSTSPMWRFEISEDGREILLLISANSRPPFVFDITQRYKRR